MVDQVGKCSVNSTLLAENAFNVNDIKEERQEDDLADEKIHISETTIIIDKAELSDHSIHDKIKEYDVSTTLDNIKTEPSSQVEYNDKFKIEEEINVDNVKIEFNNELLYCEDCQVFCEDYCAKCEMLVHILNRTVPISTNNSSQNEFPPDSILEIHDYFGEYRVFALKVIPVGVKFGPFTGINTANRPWKIKGGKFVASKDKAKCLNWMQHINPARNISERNLLVLQYEHNLYYKSTRQIQEGDELLVYFGEEYDDSLNRNVEMDFIPTVEHVFKEAYACTYCCLGFSSKLYLGKHKNICPGNEDGGFLIEELVQCQSCKIHLGQKEYIMRHMAHCYERNGRKYNRTTDVGGRKPRLRLTYKCQQCKYSTQYKADLNTHTNRHYEVKTYKCGVCRGRFKTKEILRLHVECAHVPDNGKADLEHSTGAYTRAHTKAEQFCSRDATKPFKCSLCEVRTKYKSSLKRHISEKHLKECNYKCESCDYAANQKSTLKRHIEARHMKKYKYRCEACDYKTNVKYYLKIHRETRHLKEFKHKCETCDYKTNVKSNLKSHVQIRHPKCLYIFIN